MNLTPPFKISELYKENTQNYERQKWYYSEIDIGD